MYFYLSSTYTDLKEHRESIISALPNINKAIADSYGEIQLINNEASSSLEEIEKQIAESSYFILVVGWRYGYIPEGYDKSIVEIEYELAVDKGLMVLCYVIDPDYPIPPKFYEFGVESAKLAKFKERIAQKQVLRKFGSPEDLSKSVSNDIIKFWTTPMGEAVSWSLDRPYLFNELEKVKKENSILNNKLEIFNIKWKNLVPSEPIWKSRNFSIDSTLCFALLPFEESLFVIYEEAVLPALNDSGLRGTHAGNIFDNREIIEDIWESITTARLIVADVTGRNPNVFYELGICHTLGKEVIVITQNDNDVPFDIRHRRYIKYDASKLHLLKSILEKTIKNILIKTGDNYA
jgi:hypothetical protein